MTGLGDEPEIRIGPVGPIQITDEMTPERIAASAGMVRAQKLRTVDEHINALRSDDDEWVRCEVVPRLAARGKVADPRSVRALIDTLTSDPSAMVCDAAAMALALWDGVDEEHVADVFSPCTGRRG